MCSHVDGICKAQVPLCVCVCVCARERESVQVAKGTTRSDFHPNVEWLPLPSAKAGGLDCSRPASIMQAAAVGPRRAGT